MRYSEPEPKPQKKRHAQGLSTALSQQDQVKSNITVGFFIVLYRIWALFTGTNEDKILSRALLEIFIKIGGFKPSFSCRFNWVFQKYFLSANSYSWAGEISIHLIGRNIYFYIEIRFSVFKPPLQNCNGGLKMGNCIFG